MVAVGLILLIFVFLLGLIALLSRRGVSLSLRVFVALLVGAGFGALLQYIFGYQSEAISQSLAWIDVIGSGYVRFLQMIVMPLVFVAILSAVAKLHNAAALGKISVLVLGTLFVTTAIAALVGILLTLSFDLTAEGLVQGSVETARLSAIASDYAPKVSELSAPQLLLSFIPRNPFAELTGASPTSIISVVIFAALLGIAAIRLMKRDQSRGSQLIGWIEVMQAWVTQLVRLIMGLTPYGVLALMTKMAASSSLNDIWNLGTFVLASYIGLGVMFIVHAALLMMTGVRPWVFFRKVMPALSFAFSSRSSAASIPLNVEIQTRRLGVPPTIASFSASFGATIGQNGCAGLYPAMLATMVAPTMGIDVFNPAWILTLIAIVTLSSAGVAGVGGGATMAALIVLPAMGLPVTLVALLISVEPLIDMGRTALNVSGSMTAGMVTSQVLGETDRALLDAEDDAELQLS